MAGASGAYWPSMARRHRRLLLATIAWGALSRPAVAIATPDDSSGQARVLAVGSDQERVVVGVASEWAGDWSEISVFALPSRAKVRSIPLPAAKDAPSSWLQWLRDALDSPTTLEAPRASRVSPDRTHVVTVTQRFDDGPSPHYTVTVDLVSVGGRRTVLRRRVARGCAPDRLPQRPLDLEATWIGARTVVLAGSIVAHCGVFNDVEPLLELVSVRPRARALSTARLVGLLRREAERLDAHGYGYIADRAALLTEAVELSPGDGKLRVERTAALFERGRLDRDGVLTQLLAVLAIGDERAYQALAHAREFEAFAPLSDDSEIQGVLDRAVHALEP